MHILQVASGDFFSTYGGGQVYVKQLVDEMMRQQVSLQVVSFVGRAGTIEKKTYQGIDLYEVGTEGMHQLPRLIEHIHPDLIHAHSHKAELVQIGKLLHIPVVVTAHHGGILCPAGALLNHKDQICTCTLSHRNCLPCCLRGIRSGRYWYQFMRLLPTNLYRRLGYFLAKLPFIPFVTPIGQAAIGIERKQHDWSAIADGCSLMIAPCKAISEAMQRNGLQKDKVAMLPHGIPLPAAVPSYPPVVDGKIKFFYVGRICYVKGLHVLLKAFSKVQLPHIELHLIGGTGNKTEQRYEQQLKKKYTSDPRIHWHGKVAPEQVAAIIKDFHVLVHPAIYMEIFGLNIAEALSMGKPVLATRCGGAEMQIEEGVNGWLVAPNDVEALAGGLQQISTGNVLQSIAVSQKPVISIQSHCESIINLYKQILEV